MLRKVKYNALTSDLNREENSVSVLRGFGTLAAFDTVFL